jgi:hypothetical protein
VVNFQCLYVAETKVLKQLVRDRIDPSRDLGHSDKHGKNRDAVKSPDDAQGPAVQKEEDDGVKRNPDGTVCEDCR